MGKVKEEVKDFLGRHTNEEQKEFFATAGKAFYPNAYGTLSKRSLRQAFSYLISFVFVCFAVMAILSIPKLAVFPGYIEDQLLKFNEFGITLNVNMKEPVVITNSSPQIIIDTTGKYADLTEGNILLTHDYLFYKKFGRVKQLNLSDYENLVGKEEQVQKILFNMFILLLPSIAIFAYVVYFLKYAAVILITASFALLITRALKYGIELKRLIVIAAYSSSVMAALEIITIPFLLSRHTLPFTIFFNITLGLVPLALFLCMFIIVIVLMHHRGEVKLF